MNKSQNRTHTDANVEASAAPVLRIADYSFRAVDSPLEARGEMRRQVFASQVYEVIRIEGSNAPTSASGPRATIGLNIPPQSTLFSETAVRNPSRCPGRTINA